MTKIHQVVDGSTGEVIKQEAIVPENLNFVMFFKDKMQIISEVIKENPTAARILFVFVENMDRRNILGVSQSTVAEMVGVHQATVCRAYKYLKDKGLIEIYLMGSQPIVAVNANLVWQDHANNKKYAKCQATLILSKDEQMRPRGKRLKTLSTQAIRIAEGQTTIFPEQ